MRREPIATGVYCKANFSQTSLPVLRKDVCKSNYYSCYKYKLKLLNFPPCYEYYSDPGEWYDVAYLEHPYAKQVDTNAGCIQPTTECVICEACSLQLRRINKIRLFLDFFSANVNALVISRLDFCNTLYLGLSDDLLKRLQRVRTRYARTIFNLRDVTPSPST